MSASESGVVSGVDEGRIFGIERNIVCCENEADCCAF
jgi:hypothetical protein